VLDNTPWPGAAHLQAEHGGDAGGGQPVCVVGRLQAAAHDEVWRHLIPVDAVLVAVREAGAHARLHLLCVLVTLLLGWRSGRGLSGLAIATAAAAAAAAAACRL
jgi:hypothetical protein